MWYPSSYVLAKTALEDKPDLEKIKKRTAESQVYFPNPQNVAIYQELILVYRKIEHELEASYEDLAQFQDKHPQKFE